MGLAVNGSMLPVHMLLPEEVVIRLAKPRKRRLKAEQLIAQIVSCYVVDHLRDNQLERLYADLVTEINSEKRIYPSLTLLQRHVLAIQCLRDWLIAIESAISDYQHSDAKGSKKFLFSEHHRQHTLNLRQITKLRTFLCSELEVPLHAPRPDRPNYEG